MSPGYTVIWDGRRSGPGGAFLFVEPETPAEAGSLPRYRTRGISSYAPKSGPRVSRGPIGMPTSTWGAWKQSSLTAVRRRTSPMNSRTASVGAARSRGWDAIYRKHTPVIPRSTDRRSAAAAIGIYLSENSPGRKTAVRSARSRRPEHSGQPNCPEKGKVFDNAAATPT